MDEWRCSFSTDCFSFTVPRDRWSEDLAGRPRLSSPEHSEEELENREDEVQAEEDREEHVYQTLDRREDNSGTEPVYAVSLKLKVRYSTLPMFISNQFMTGASPL